MPPELMKSYSNSLLSVVTFSSNFHFYVSSGYFSSAADHKPLLHTWSLAVEEQYYILFPFLLMTLTKIGLSNMIKITITLTLASLLLSQYLASTQQHDANFYLIFSRAWELLVGSLIALTGITNNKVSNSLRDLLGLLGLGLIAYAMLTFDNHTPFPSFYTLIPIVGSALLIIFTNEKSLTGKFLGNRVFVGIGLISYSLYLWHQPLFAITRLKTEGDPPEAVFIALIALTFILAFLTFKFIETPFRKRQITFNVPPLTLAIRSIIFFIILGIAGVASKGFNFRFNNEYTKTIQHNPLRKECHTRGIDYKKPSEACRYFGDNVIWAAFGDSHVVETSYALAKAIESNGEGLIHLSFSSCAPGLLFEASNPGCSAWIKDSVEYLIEEKEIKNILIAFRYSAFLYGDHSNHYPELPNENPVARMAKQHSSLSADKARELYWKSFSAIIEQLVAANKRVVILFPIPEIPDEIVNMLSPFSLFSDELPYDLIKTTPEDYYFKRNQFILGKLNTLNFNDKLLALRPYNILCRNGYCPAVADGKSLYFDDSHISLAGAEIIIKNSSIFSEEK
jgi:peptidoglycan/LPS O-acetylase OafA/YrhL